jgi:5-methylcytosine-specific restriction endonuclease McrA
VSSIWEWPPGWKKLREATFRRHGRVCWRCGSYANTVDHVVPRVLGGTHELSNLRPACSSCNSSTGASVGNRLRPRRPLTGSQRRAIAARNAGKLPRSWPQSRNW